MTGEEYLESIRDGRRVHVGGELVEDVRMPKHPAFRNVPWERVFCHDNIEMTRAIYMFTPGHAMANHQAIVRFLEKLKLILGIARKLVDMNGAGAVPAVQSTLGRLAAMVATLEGLIMGQINCGEAQTRPITPSTAATSTPPLHWCTNNHAQICDTVREMMAACVFQMPADASVLGNLKASALFEAYWATPGQSSKDRMTPLNLAWDLLSSDFAGRHMQYEKFYAGPGFVMDGYSLVTAPWKEWSGRVDELLGS